MKLPWTLLSRCPCFCFGPCDKICLTLLETLSLLLKVMCVYLLVLLPSLEVLDTLDFCQHLVLSISVPYFDSCKRCAVVSHCGFNGIHYPFYLLIWQPHNLFHKWTVFSKCLCHLFKIWIKKMYLFMCMCMYVRVPTEVRRGHQILGR